MKTAFNTSSDEQDKVIARIEIKQLIGNSFELRRQGDIGRLEGMEFKRMKESAAPGIVGRAAITLYESGLAVFMESGNTSILRRAIFAADSVKPNTAAQPA
nr:hypothetical protein [Chromobacterium sp. ASV5]